MQITATSECALQVLMTLARHSDGPLSSERIADLGAVPRGSLENALSALRRGGLVASQRGVHGGFRLAVPADEVTVAHVLRLTDGPLLMVRQYLPEELVYDAGSAVLQRLWFATRASLRHVYEQVTISDLIADSLCARVAALATDHDASVARPESVTAVHRLRR